jgi:hypothetical protein
MGRTSLLLWMTRRGGGRCAIRRMLQCESQGVDSSGLVDLPLFDGDT